MINCLDVIQMIIYEGQSKSSRFRFLSLRNTFSLVFLSLVFFVLLSVFLIVLSLETEANLAMAQLLIPFAHKHYSLCHLTFASFYLNLGVPLNIVPGIVGQSMCHKTTKQQLVSIGSFAIRKKIF